MADQRGLRGRAVLGLFEQSFQASGGAGEEESFDFTHSFDLKRK